MLSVPSSVRSLLVAAPIAKRHPQPAIERALSMEEVLIVDETSSLDEARSGLYPIARRALDIVAAAAALILLLPVFAIVALLIWLQDHGPVFCVQMRTGLEGRHFRFPRFRSMRVDADRIQQSRWELDERKDGVVFKIKADPRITRVGRFLRKYGIDELPQLWCVLRGDMTLMGSRPPLPCECAAAGCHGRAAPGP